MKKIISLFQRNYETDRLVRDEVVPGAEWVIAGEGVATRKWDGVCTLIRDGKLYKRFEAKDEHFVGTKKLPDTWEPSDERDPTTGKQMGWVLVDEQNAKSEDRFMLEALHNTFGNRHRDGGTYEFVGPKSQGNVEQYWQHRLVRHGGAVVNDAPHTFAELRGYFIDRDIEGIVWHHPDGRMVKIKARDFGIRRAKHIRFHIGLLEAHGENQSKRLRHPTCEAKIDLGPLV